MTESDVFPSTAREWIASALEGPGGRLAVNRHIMEVYEWPLRVYYTGGWRLRFGDAKDVVAGFFASRLDRDNFLDAWLASELRLRVWLRNGFRLYLKELARLEKKSRRIKKLDDEGQVSPPSPAPSPEILAERAFVSAIVTKAQHETRLQCMSEGLEAHWQVFLLHFYGGEPYSVVAKTLGVSPGRAAVMARAVTRRFRVVLCNQLIRDGVSPNEVDNEIRNLLEIGE